MQSKIVFCGIFSGSRNGLVDVPKRWLRIARTLPVIAFFSIFSHAAVAQTTSSVLNPNQGFTLVGPIQNFTLTTPGNVLSGGTITVNGVTVKIPANTVVTMPTSFLTVNQIFRGTTQGAVPAATSGLALNDPVRRPGAFNAEIHGNMIIDPAAPGTRTYYAGLISIAPDALQTSDGFIRNINYATGELCIGGDPTPAAACPATDTRVRLNDPNAKYGIAQVSPDKRFAVDEGNATVTSNTGYPMCIPRVAPPAVDTLCPIGNRPINLGNQYLSTFVMNGTANYTAGAVPKDVA